MRLLLTVCAIVAPVVAVRGWKTIESVPDLRPVTVTVKGKPRVYFRLAPQTPLAFTITGPARLRVISRLVLPDKEATGSYGLQILEGDRVLAAMTETATASREAKAAGIAALGKSRKLEASVPEGRHALTLVLSGPQAALARLQTGSAQQAQEWVSLTPIRAARSVTVVEGQKSIVYYSVLPSSPAVLRVSGPSTLDCMTRLDFDATMRGAQSYRLRLVEGGKTLRTVEFKTQKSGAATYSNLKDRVPSRYDRFSHEVGMGVHEIEIQLIKPATGSAEIHARIPAPSVGETE